MPHKKLQIQKDFDSASFLLTLEQAIYLLGFLSSSKNRCLMTELAVACHLKEFLIYSLGKDWRRVQRKMSYSSKKNCLKKEKARSLHNWDHWVLLAWQPDPNHMSTLSVSEQLPFHGLEHSYISDLQGIYIFSLHGVSGRLNGWSWRSAEHSQYLK